MNDTSMPVVGRNLLGVVVPMLLCFSLGFVVGITCNTKFPNFYLPFVPPLPSARMWSPSPPPLLPPPVPSSPPPPALQPPPPPSPPPPTPSTTSVQSPKVELMIGSLSSVKSNNMTDEELLWWASMSPKVRATPYHRVPKVAFLFLARGDLPLRPLWEKFFQGHDGLYSIYVHADPSYTGSPPEDSVFYDRMIRSQNTSWGDVTLVDAARRLVANALLDLGNQRFALLSESCIPLYNFTTVYALLTGSNTSFVDSFVNHNSEVRYDPFFGQRAAGGNITLAQWRKGAQWFEMDRALAVELVSDDTYFPAFREYCARNRYCFAEEHYLPTLLSVLGWTRNANRTLTYADWRGGGSHPRTHGAGDATEALIREIRASTAGGGFGPGGENNCTAYNDGGSGVCYVFARKFAPDTLEPLLRLAPMVMGFG
ncbi:glycosyltransferase BC10-like [Miscanthus floridulus]|uniref:glycosyltransferase BC10-like n=1 Tax=Miscanthus floridulus TaxID=154761 RepID=UPI003458958B